MKTYNDGVNACLAVIEKKMDNLRAPKYERFNDPASGRTEEIEEGEWMGSAYEKQLFTELSTKFAALLRYE